MSTHRGFTFPEVLFSLSLFAFLICVGIVVYGSFQAQARNEERLVAVTRYELGLQNVYTAFNGSYPAPGEGHWCLTNDKYGRCWGNGYGSSPVLDGRLQPFMSSRPEVSATGLDWEGVLYTQQNGGANYFMLWFLEGDDLDCDPGFQLDPNYADRGNTLCALYR